MDVISEVVPGNQFLLVSQIVEKLQLGKYAIKKASNSTFRPRSSSLFTSPPRGDFTVILEPKTGGGEGDVYLILSNKDERVSAPVLSGGVVPS